jgi:3-oxoadipate enol-lactonase
MPEQHVNGTTLFYTEQGQGKPLVLLHGFPLDSRIWEAQIEALSNERRVIAPDLRGFGRSRSNALFTIESLAEDVHALLEVIGALPCALAGLSMGGYVAFAFAKKYPADLTALALIDTRCEGESAQGKDGRNKMIDLVRRNGSKAVADQMFPKMFVEGIEQRDQALAGRLRQIMEACPAQTIEHALLAMRDRLDYCSILPSIPVPTLIVVGEKDPITPPAIAEAMHRQIPRSQLVQIANASHLTTMEQPQAVNGALKSFLASSV